MNLTYRCYVKFEYGRHVSWKHGHQCESSPIACEMCT